MKITVRVGRSGDIDLNRLKALREDMGEVERAIEVGICALVKKHDIQSVQVDFTYHLSNDSGTRKVDTCIAEMAVVV